MREGIFWTARIVTWACILGFLMTILPAGLAVLAIGIVVFGYFASEFYLESITPVDQIEIEIDEDDWELYQHERAERSLEDDC